jgi:ketosteroid isomerase-like protein
MGSANNHQVARDFLAAVASGDLPDALLTPDMSAWLTTGGSIDKSRYQSGVRTLRAVCASPIKFTIDALTAEDDRVVAEARSEATLVNGAKYQNTYVFVIRVSDGRIASVAEHYDALVVQEVLVPALTALSRSAQRPVEKS